MSYYGGDHPPPPRKRPADVNEASRQPVTKTVGAGNRTRITVETGDDSAKFRQHLQAGGAVTREHAAARIKELKLRRAEEERYRAKLRVQKSTPYRRRNSSPIRSTYSLPSPRHSRPLGDEFVDESEASIPPSLDESDDEGDDYDFKLPKPLKILKYAEPVTFEMPESGRKESSYEPSPTGKPKFNGEIIEVPISHSRWLGSPFERGELAGEIATLPATDSTETSQRPSMKWYHLERFMMNFEEFIAASLSVLELPEKEVRDVTKLLRDVQKRFEKQRHHGRDMDPDCVSDVFFSNVTGAGDKGKQTESLIFLSFPYFSLDPHASTQINTLTPESPMHPLRPMLQAHFYATSRQRELEQVITRMPGTSQGECLHLSQLWCLIINGSTMVTCSRLQIDTLCGETIMRTSASTLRKSTHLKVSAINNRSWRVPVTPEMSWPAFLSFFADQIAEMELYGGTAQFEDDTVIIDGNNWPDFVRAAFESPAELRMKYIRLHAGASDIQEDPELIGSGLDENDSLGTHMPAQSAEDIAAPSDRDVHQEFQTIKAAPTLPLETSHSLQLFKHAGSSTYMRSLADGFHTVLRSTNRSREKAAYLKCPAAKAADIESWLTLNGQRSFSGLESRTDALLTKYKTRLASISKYLFCLFWPLEFEHQMADKYWGAVYQILSRDHEFFEKGNLDPKSDIAEASEFYYGMRDRVLPRALSIAREFLTYESDLRPLPEAFSKAWLHVVTALVMTAQKPLNKNFSFSKSPTDGHLKALTEDLSKAHRELGAKLRKGNIEDLEVCHESGLLALLVNRLARDNMRGRPDVARAYGDYFQGLEFNVTQDPVPRTHQETIRFFLQEVEAILTTLQNQMSVLDVFERSLEQQMEHDDPLFEDALGESRQSLVIESCRAWIGGRIDKFKGLQQRALDLGEWHRNEMNTNKDRQEKAILVFTIVTIIFLPLSFVSSVFGMNTADIRDMSYRQWAYWAAGLPLTVVVVVASLWFAGELESLGRWLARTMSRSKSSSDYQELKDYKLEKSERRSRKRQGLRTQSREDDLEERLSRPRRRTTYPIKDG